MTFIRDVRVYAQNPSAGQGLFGANYVYAEIGDFSAIFGKKRTFPTHPVAMVTKFMWEKLRFPDVSTSEDGTTLLLLR